MVSIFEQALGARFAELHPRLQRRFGVSSRDDLAQVGGGVMTHTSRGAIAALPVALLGSARRIELPAAGTNVRFDLANYAYLDSFGRETFAYSRRFHVGGHLRRFDDTMIYSEHRGSIVNYLGSHQDLAAELELAVTPEGWLRMTGGAQRLHLGPVGIKLPQIAAARAEVIETWDAAADRFTISVEIDSPVGRLFSYRGWFAVDDVPMPRADLPRAALPDRERRAD